MATFSYQLHHPFLLDSAYLLNGSVKMSHEQDGNMSMNNASSCFPYYNSTNAISEFSPTDVKSHESSSSLDSSREVVEEQRELSVAAEQLQGSDEISKTQCPSEKKRKEKKRCHSSSAQSEDAKEVKGKKQKKCSSKEAMKEPSKADEGGKKAFQEPPFGYIHVRARRGQATDSHSLAERVRREKISERMKLLQGLVPGCDKVTGKALMLDEIINYVQSLQNQVEFLSMKLASVNPTLYEFGLDLEDYMVPQEKLESMSPQPLPSVQQASHIQPTAFPATTNNYPTLDTSSAFLLHGQGQGPSTSSQEHGSIIMQVGDHRQAFLNQVVFNNMCSFH